MSSEDHRNIPQPPPIYTIHPGGYQNNINHGFDTAPPPKYEDVVNGIHTEQRLPEAAQQPQATEVILISPVGTSITNATVTRYIFVIAFALGFLFTLKIMDIL